MQDFTSIQSWEACLVSIYGISQPATSFVQNKKSCVLFKKARKKQLRKELTAFLFHSVLVLFWFVIQWGTHQHKRSLGPGSWLLAARSTVPLAARSHSRPQLRWGKPSAQIPVDDDPWDCSLCARAALRAWIGGMRQLAQWVAHWKHHAPHLGLGLRPSVRCGGACIRICNALCASRRPHWGRGWVITLPGQGWEKLGTA